MVKMGTVWDRTTAFLAADLARIAPIALLFMLLPLIAQALLGPLVLTVGTAEKVVLEIVVLLLSLALLAGQLAIMALAIDPALATRAALVVAGRRLPLAIGLALLVGLAFVVLMLPPLLAMIASGVEFAMTGPARFSSVSAVPSGVGWFVAIYVFVLVVVLVWLLARLSLMNAVIVAERRGLGTFARSFALTRGLALKIVGVVLLFLIVLWVSRIAAETVIGSILRLIFGGVGLYSLAGVLTVVIVSAVTIGFSVLADIFLAKLYVAARAAHDPIAEPA